MIGVPRASPGKVKFALFSYGFRPFFLAGSAWAAIAVLLWLPQFLGEIELVTAFAPRDWHVHELLYGYLAAIITGFLLTALPNWTGRVPVAGPALAVLFALWLAGRIAILLSAAMGAVLTAIVDVAFLAVLASLAVREISASQNWRNLRVVAVLSGLIVGNALFHFEAAVFGIADYGIRIGIASAVVLIMLIGGRIVPSFTHNFLRREPGPHRLPQSFSRFDAVSIVAGAAALVAWIVWPGWTATGWLLITAGVLHCVRLARWSGHHTISQRLVLVLHVGYSFVPIGFLMTGVASIRPDLLPTSAAVHAWAVGAIGMMTLAVMTRATLGHTGRALAASRATEVIYALVFLAAIARIGASFTYQEILLHIAALAWVGAFGGFVLIYGPMLAVASPARSNLTE